MPVKPKHHQKALSHTKHHYKPMDKVKIKRAKRAKRKIGKKEKALAALGVGGTLLGATGAVAPKSQATQFVREQPKEEGATTSKIKQTLKRIFGVGRAQAADSSADRDAAIAAADAAKNQRIADLDAWKAQAVADADAWLQADPENPAAPSRHQEIEDAYNAEMQNIANDFNAAIDAANKAYQAATAGVLLSLPPLSTLYYDLAAVQNAAIPAAVDNAYNAANSQIDSWQNTEAAALNAWKNNADNAAAGNAAIQAQVDSLHQQRIAEMQAEVDTAKANVLAAYNAKKPFPVSPPAPTPPPTPPPASILYSITDLNDNANRLTYDADKVNNTLLNNTRTIWLQKLASNDVSYIAGDSVLAYMLGWGGEFKDGESRTVSGQTFVYDAGLQQWILQVSPPASVYDVYLMRINGQDVKVTYDSSFGNIAVIGNNVHRYNDDGTLGARISNFSAAILNAINFSTNVTNLLPTVPPPVTSPPTTPPTTPPITPPVIPPTTPPVIPPTTPPVIPPTTPPVTPPPPAAGLSLIPWNEVSQLFGQTVANNARTMVESGVHPSLIRELDKWTGNIHWEWKMPGGPTGNVNIWVYDGATAVWSGPSPAPFSAAEALRRIRLSMPSDATGDAATGSAAGTLPPGFVMPPGGFPPGTPLPGGLVVGPGGTIVGRGTATGGGAAATGGGQVTGQQAAAAMNITTASLPNARVGEEYRFTIRAAGAGASVFWQITAGQWPVGLNLDPLTGVISGATAVRGTYTFTVMATDLALGRTASKQFTLTALPSAAATAQGMTGQQGEEVEEREEGEGDHEGREEGKEEAEEESEEEGDLDLEEEGEGEEEGEEAGRGEEEGAGGEEAGGEREKDEKEEKEKKEKDFWKDLDKKGDKGKEGKKTGVEAAGQNEQVIKDLRGQIIQLESKITELSGKFSGQSTSAELAAAKNEIAGLRQQISDLTVAISRLQTGSTVRTFDAGGAQGFQGLKMPAGYPASGGSAGLQMPAGYPASGDQVQSVAAKGQHTVKKGDTLWAIAKKYYGDGKKWRKILEANPDCLSRPGNTRTLRIGFELVIPE